jgi:hypothetical protein
MTGRAVFVMRMISARVSSLSFGIVFTPKTAGLLIKNANMTAATKIAVQRSSTLPFSMLISLPLFKN